MLRLEACPAPSIRAARRELAGRLGDSSSIRHTMGARFERYDRYLASESRPRLGGQGRSLRGSVLSELGCAVPLLSLVPEITPCVDEPEALEIELHLYR